MARQKAIKIPDASFQSASWVVKSEVLTSLIVSAPFDQLVAEALGVKEQIFDSGHLPEDFKSWGGRQELYGAKLFVLPKQGRLEDGTIRPGADLRSLKVHKFKVVRDQASDALRITFTLTGLDEGAEIHSLVHAMRRDLFDATITPASKEASTAAQNQMKLFTAKKPEETQEDGDGQDVEE